MKNYKSTNIRNVAVLGHGKTGKKKAQKQKTGPPATRGPARIVPDCGVVAAALAHGQALTLGFGAARGAAPCRREIWGFRARTRTRVGA